MMEPANHQPVPLEQLRWTCDPETLGVASTAEVTRLEDKVIAQERAVTALQFGMRMKGSDYNIFVVGQPKTGLSHLTRSFLIESARQEENPPDWCYVYNFKEPERPKAISLKGGMARELAKDMEELLVHLKADIPAAFEGEDYRRRREEAIKKFSTERNQVLADLEKAAHDQGFILNVSQQGMMIVPAGKEGKPLTEEELTQMDQEGKDQLRKQSEGLHEQMNNSVIRIRQLERDLRNAHMDLDRRVALHAVGYLIDEIQEKFEGNKAVLAYLVEVKNDVVRNLKDFQQQEQQPPTPFPIPSNEPDFTRYQVNVLIDNSETQGAPVIYETNPTYTNLFGAVERRASFGALFTDFTMIRPGSLHQANGGYLVMQARDLLKWMISWEALKRALKNNAIAIEDQAEMYGIISTRSLKPEPIPLKVKIILLGDPYLFHLLYAYDEQFKKLFKVKAHLDDEVERNDEELQKYTSFAARCVEECHLRHVDKTGLARLLEYGVEKAGRQKKLTLRMALIRDVLREADYWAEQDGSDLIQCQHVDKAIGQMKFRSGLPEEKMREFLLEGYVNVETQGDKVGQINGLSVYDLGDHAFGRPSRITAAISLGKQGVVNIDRESKLSGNIHTKGLLIMEGFLRSRYAKTRPLSLSASLVFEQSYGMVDGDSASAAELFALLSQIAEVPLKQTFAVTGAISQQGEIQPIGGVNYKIEGFFEICKARGLTGDQGVIIPKANVQDLMLKGEVLEAVRNGKFRVYSVDHVDQALEILTGMPAGSLDEEGAFTEGSFNRLVEDRLIDLAEKAKKEMKDNDEEKKSGGDNANGCDQCGH